MTSVVSRSTVMKSAGKTMLATWLTAGLLYVAILFLSDLFVYIPAASLAGVVIIAASSLFQPSEIKVRRHLVIIHLVTRFWSSLAQTVPVYVNIFYFRECGMHVLLI